jgi:hypothetical protein
VFFAGPNYATALFKKIPLSSGAENNRNADHASSAGH